MKLHYTIIFSVFLHTLLFVVLNNFDLQTLRKKDDKKVEVIVLTEEESKKAKYFRSPKMPEPKTPTIDAIKSPPPAALLLSEKNQTFKKQQQAKYKGVQNTNRSAPITANDRKLILKKLEKLKKVSKALLGKLERANTPTAPAAAKNSQLFEPSSLPSTITDPLTNIPIGSFSALNTNRYLYYSFFTRVEDQIRGRWVSRLRQAMVHSHQVKNKNQEVWTTNLEIVLDQNGDFVRADVLKSSGIPSFDYAAIDAFREGAPISNPPEGLIDKDGLIRLNYAMNVYWKP